MNKYFQLQLIAFCKQRIGFHTKSFIILYIVSAHLFALAQDTTLTEKQKIRYVKKTEKKNECFVKQQEKRTNKLLTRLSKQEKLLFSKMDSVKDNISLTENSFESLKSKLNEPLHISPEAVSGHLNNSIIDADLKDYLNKQLNINNFISDSTCTISNTLRKKTIQAKQNITRTKEKLEKLKSIETEIKKRKEFLNNYGVNIPELKRKLKSLDKSLYYFNRGTDGFKDLYTNPAKGIESKLLSKLSFSKSFSMFEDKIKQLSLPAFPSIGGMPDLTGYQTKVQVQAMLPQNNPGIDADVKTQIVNNLQNSIKKFFEIRDEKPDVSMFKDKPTFKVNPYRGLPLRKRITATLVFEPRIQNNQKPIITTLGINVGFKLTGRLTPMMGAATRIGLGETLQHPSITYEGIIARAGIDSKIAYGFSLQVWYEETWKPNVLTKFTENKNNKPIPSFIAGICNTYKISKRAGGSFMIGYNFLNNKYTPLQSPWVIRMGIQ